MSVKLVRISGKVHRPLAIQAATDGVTISSIVERAIREELSRIKKKKEASRQKRIDRKKKSEANEMTATSDGSPAGARGPNSK